MSLMVVDTGGSSRYASGVSVGFLHVFLSRRFIAWHQRLFSVVCIAEAQIAAPIPQPLPFAAAGAEPIAFKLSRAGGHYGGPMFRSVI